jgi:hypothetical protein
MKEIIEQKLEDYIVSLLNKDTIERCDYFVLKDYLQKINIEDSAKKWESSKSEREEAIKSFFAIMSK